MVPVFFPLFNSADEYKLILYKHIFLYGLLGNILNFTKKFKNYFFISRTVTSVRILRLFLTVLQKSRTSKVTLFLNRTPVYYSIFGFYD